MSSPTRVPMKPWRKSSETNKFYMEPDTGHTVALRHVSNIILIHVPFIFFFLFCTMTNKCTIISQIITLLHVSILSCHLRELVMNTLIINCITISCIWNACVSWQGIDYKLPEDDTIVSKHVEMW